MIDKIYYSIASISLIIFCIKECYDSKYKKKDYIKVNSIECNLREDFNYSLLDETNEIEIYNTSDIVKKDRYIIDMN